MTAKSSANPSSKKLLGRGWEAFTLTTYNHCPNCGWAVDIEYTD